MREDMYMELVGEDQERVFKDIKGMDQGEGCLSFYSKSTGQRVDYMFPVANMKICYIVEEETDEAE